MSQDGTQGGQKLTSGGGVKNRHPGGTLPGPKNQVPGGVKNRRPGGSFFDFLGVHQLPSTDFHWGSGPLFFHGNMTMDMLRSSTPQPQKSWVF